MRHPLQPGFSHFFIYNIFFFLPCAERLFWHLHSVLHKLSQVSGQEIFFIFIFSQSDLIYSVSGCHNSDNSRAAIRGCICPTCLLRLFQSTNLFVCGWNENCQLFQDMRWDLFKNLTVMALDLAAQLLASLLCYWTVQWVHTILNSTDRKWVMSLLCCVFLLGY